MYGPLPDDATRRGHLEAEPAAPDDLVEGVRDEEDAVRVHGEPGRLIEMDDTRTMFSQPSVQATEDYISGRFG